MEKRAVCLLSGGIDSTTAMAVAKSEGYELHALSFGYGQRHKIELSSASMVADSLGAKQYKIMRFDLTEWGGSALTDEKVAVPEWRDMSRMSADIPASYVPARNTIFLAFAMAWAETLQCSDIFAGMNAVDYSGYPDCRPEYLAKYQELMDLATREGVEGRQKMKIHAPLLHLSKKDIVLLGTKLGVDYKLTHSCYNPDGIWSCGKCDSCIIRHDGFISAGLVDPTVYVTGTKFE